MFVASAIVVVALYTYLTVFVLLSQHFQANSDWLLGRLCGALLRMRSRWSVVPRSALCFSAGKHFRVCIFVCCTYVLLQTFIFASSLFACLVRFCKNRVAEYCVRALLDYRQKVDASIEAIWLNVGEWLTCYSGCKLLLTPFCAAVATTLYFASW